MCMCVHTHTHPHFGLCAAAKSLQSCPTLCDPIDGSLWGDLITPKGHRDKSLFTMIVPESCHFHFLFISFTLRRVLENLVYHRWHGLLGW